MLAGFELTATAPLDYFHKSRDRHSAGCPRVVKSSKGTAFSSVAGMLPAITVFSPELITRIPQVGSA